jgi:hypothetical protein
MSCNLQLLEGKQKSAADCRCETGMLGFAFFGQARQASQIRQHRQLLHVVTSTIPMPVRVASTTQERLLTSPSRAHNTHFLVALGEVDGSKPSSQRTFPSGRVVQTRNHAVVEAFACLP